MKVLSLMLGEDQPAHQPTLNPSTVFICTNEGSGVDRYSSQLARRLPVDILFCRRYRPGLQAYSLLKKARKSDHIVHLSNQHFGRYAFLTGVESIVTVHDLARICFFFDRENIVERVGLYLDALAIKRARHIIAVSQNTKRDLMKHLGVPEEKITVIYNGVDRGVFQPTPGLPFPFPYILYVGSERPRKNLGRLLAAFALLKRSGELPTLKLVKVGRAGRSSAFRRNTLRAIENLRLEGEVILTEHVTDRELARLYSSATVLVYPSIYEGFGLPVVEAMACHCPVITSHTSSLPEVAGNAALLVDPHDVEGLSGALALVLTNADLRRRLVAAGQERIRTLSWDKAAAATLAVYHNVERLRSSPTAGSVIETTTGPGGSRQALGWERR